MSIQRNPPAGSHGTTIDELAQLDLPQLCNGWRGCARSLAETSLVDLRHALAHLRALYLDELERRDPAGFELWVAEDPLRTNPERYLRPRPVATSRAARRLPRGQ